MGLPGELWGPMLELGKNAADTGFVRETLEFTCQHSDTGLLKRTIRYAGMVNNDMLIDDFPFDLEFIELKFDTEGCTYETLDGKIKGDCSKRRTYELEPVPFVEQARQNEQNRELFEGSDMKMHWNRSLPGWSVFAWGYYTEMYRTESGAPHEAACLVLFMGRSVSNDIIKIIVPLIMTTYMGLFVHLGPFTELYERLSYLATMFLALIAFFGSGVMPRTNYRTIADRVALAGISVTCVDGLLCCASVSRVVPDESKEQFDSNSGAVVFVLFTLFFCGRCGGLCGRISRLWRSCLDT